MEGDKMELTATNKGAGAFDAFLNLLSLITLGWTAISTGSLFFALIDKYFSGALSGFGFGSSGAIRFSVSSLIIILPVFIFSTRYLYVQYKKNKLNPHSGIRKWLTYLILLISALNIIGSLVAVVYNFLGGDYTISFILKALTVLIIASAIFSYYWYILAKKEYSQPDLISRSAAIVVAVVVSGFMIFGATLIESPAQMRKINNDQARVGDLTNISYALDSYYQSNGKLPELLSEMSYVSYKDPITDAPYTYGRKTDTKYELCASFEADNSSNDKQNGSVYVDAFTPWGVHAVGYQCFIVSVRTAKNDVVPTIPDNKF